MDIPESKQGTVIHPFLFSLYSLFFLYAHNSIDIHIKHVLMPMLFTLLVVLFLFIVLKTILNDRIKSGLILTVVSFLFFTYGHFYNSLEIGLYFLGLISWADYYFPSVYGFSLILSAFVIIRTKRNLGRINAILNGVTALLLTFVILSTAITQIRSYLSIRGSREKTTQVAKGSLKSPLADIYYIVVDGFTAIEILERYFGFGEGEDLRRNLKELGFYLAEKSISNYVQTHLSLASSLNMEYIDFLSERIGENSRDESLTYWMIRNSKIVNILKSIGYTVQNYDSGYGSTRTIANADINYSPRKWQNDFLRLLKRMTLLRLVNYDDPHIKRELVPLTLRSLAERAPKNSPKFVLAHLLSPHPPFIFKPDGKLVENPNHSLVDWSGKDRYLNEIRFLSREVLETVKSIIQHSKVNPIIILQSDHGSSLLKGHRHLVERGRILNAYHLTKKCEESLYQSISPVNTFRIILNCVFDKNYEILKDETYYSNSSKPFKFKRITSEVRYVD